MTTSIDTEKAFDKIQHPFMIFLKNPQKAVIEGTYLNIIKAIYDKPTANIFNGEKLKIFPLKSGTGQGCRLSTTTIQHCFGSFSHSNQSRKRNKGIQIGKKKNFHCLQMT